MDSDQVATDTPSAFLSRFLQGITRSEGKDRETVIVLIEIFINGVGPRRLAGEP